MSHLVDDHARARAEFEARANVPVIREILAYADDLCGGDLHAGLVDLADPEMPGYNNDGRKIGHLRKVAELALDAYPKRPETPVEAAAREVAEAERAKIDAARDAERMEEIRRRGIVEAELDRRGLSRVYRPTWRVRGANGPGSDYTAMGDEKDRVKEVLWDIRLATPEKGSWDAAAKWTFERL